jgi:hypothetical protein
MLRFYYGFQPDQLKEKVLQCCAAFLRQVDIFDIAVDQLRTWALWELTNQVLALYKESEAPLAKRSIVRYALSCPLPEAKAFVEKLRQKDPMLIEDVQESLKYKQTTQTENLRGSWWTVALCVCLCGLGCWVGRGDVRAFRPIIG